MKVDALMNPSIGQVATVSGKPLRAKFPRQEELFEII